MYCVKCGCELADSEEKCPICGIRAYHPDVERTLSDPLYPDNPKTVRQSVSRFGAMFIVTSIFILGVLVSLICNISLSGEITWSGIVTGALILGYVLVILPIWFRSPNPVIFVPCDFAACTLYLLYIDIFTDGDWFLTFAFPTVGGSMIIVTAVLALCRYVRKGYLYIFGGAAILTGAQCVLMEFLINHTFEIYDKLVWSFYPFIVCLIIGLLLIIIAICPALRTTLEKKFFV
ncbi:MAG: DUF6320 domain-containing protein [Ruminococcus sp.]|nr:DUF6320 domain-containing protein [Ruminococcus sp.]